MHRHTLQIALAFSVRTVRLQSKGFVLTWPVPTKVKSSSVFSLIRDTSTIMNAMA